MKKHYLSVWVFITTALVLSSPADTVPDLANRDGIDWPSFLGPDMNGTSSEKGIRKDWGRTGLPILWEKLTGEGYSAPTIYRGRLFFFDREGDKARLTCMHAETGETIWQQIYPIRYEDMYGYSNGPRVSPLVDRDRVYTFGVEGRLRCHRVRDGDLVWDVDTATSYGVVKNFFGVGASPVILNDLLIVMVGGSPPGSPAVRTGKTMPNGSAIVAFDKTTGKEVYKLGQELASYAAPRLVQRGNRWWAFAFTRGGLLAFDPRTGQKDFHFPWRATRLESVNAAMPVVVQDQVLITEAYGKGSALLRFRPGTFELSRQDKPRSVSLGCHWSTPIFKKGYVYAASGMGGGSDFRCVAWETGELAWKIPGMRHANAIMVDDHLIVTTENGDLRLVRATHLAYRERAIMKKVVDRPAYNGPVLARGLLYMLGNHKLVCLELVPNK